MYFLLCKHIHAHKWLQVINTSRLAYEYIRTGKETRKRWTDQYPWRRNKSKNALYNAAAAVDDDHHQHHACCRISFKCIRVFLTPVPVTSNIMHLTNFRSLNKHCYRKPKTFSKYCFHIDKMKHGKRANEYSYSSCLNNFTVGCMCSHTDTPKKRLHQQEL
jgi:hypothetical protein